MTMTNPPSDLWEFVAPLDSDERFILAAVLIVLGALALVLTVAIIARTLGRCTGTGWTTP